MCLLNFSVNTLSVFLQAACENGVRKKSNVTGEIVFIFSLGLQSSKALFPDQCFLSTHALRCGVFAAPAAFAKRSSGGTLPSHQGPPGGAAAGRRSTGGLTGPDTDHPQSPSSCFCSTSRNTAHTYSGQTNWTWVLKDVTVKKQMPKWNAVLWSLTSDHIGGLYISVLTSLS